MTYTDTIIGSKVVELFGSKVKWFAVERVFEDGTVKYGKGSVTASRKARCQFGFSKQQALKVSYGGQSIRLGTC